MTAPILIFAIGNESRGDDALGPLLMRKLEAWLIESGLSCQFELLEEFQLQIEHATDMENRQLVLFIDAGMDTPSPFAFLRAEAHDEPVLYSHALKPHALLKVYRQFYQTSPPDAFILCIKGASFELGEPLSTDAAGNLASALSFIRQRLLDPQASAWDRQRTDRTPDSL